MTDARAPAWNLTTTIWFRPTWRRKMDARQKEQRRRIRLIRGFQAAARLGNRFSLHEAKAKFRHCEPFAASLSQQSKRKGKTVWQSAFNLAGLHNHPLESLRRLAMTDERLAMTICRHCEPFALDLSQQSKRKGKTVWQSAFNLAGHTIPIGSSLRKRAMTN